MSFQLPLSQPLSGSIQRLVVYKVLFQYPLYIIQLFTSYFAPTYAFIAYRPVAIFYPVNQSKQVTQISFSLYKIHFYDHVLPKLNKLIELFNLNTIHLYGYSEFNKLKNKKKHPFNYEMF